MNPTTTFIRLTLLILWTSWIPSFCCAQSSAPSPKSPAASSAPPIPAASSANPVPAASSAKPVPAASSAKAVPAANGAGPVRSTAEPSVLSTHAVFQADPLIDRSELDAPASYLGRPSIVAATFCVEHSLEPEQETASGSSGVRAVGSQDKQQEETPADAKEKREELAKEIKLAEAQVKQDESGESAVRTPESDPATSPRVAAAVPDPQATPQPANSATPPPTAVGAGATPTTAPSTSPAPATNKNGAPTTPAKTEISSVEEKRLRLLKQIDVALAQQQQQASALEDLNKELAEREKELNEIHLGRLGIEPPYSFLLLDQLREEAANIKSKIDTNEANLILANEDVVRVKEQLEKEEQALRIAKEQGGRDAAEAAALGTLRVQLAQETLTQRKQWVEIIKARAKLYKIQSDIIAAKLDQIESKATFSEDDLKNKIGEFDKREESLRRQLRSLEWAMEDADAKWLSDRNLLATTTEKTPKLTEEIELRRFQRQYLQTRIASLNYRLELLGQSRQIWEQRYQFINDLVDHEKTIEFEANLKRLAEQRDRDLTNRNLRLSELRKTVASLDTKSEAYPDDDAGRELKRIIDRQKDVIRSTMTVLDDEIAAIQVNRALIQKFRDEINGDGRRFTFQRLWETTCYYAKQVWNTELTQVDDRPVTIGKILLALCIFFGGFVVARIASRRLRNFLSSRLRIDESAAAAFQSLAFYGLVISFLLGALNFVSIPLTVFTFLGGALAIGVGFGSQNILSNFISGLILLAERPVKVGDLIQMDSFYGNVENIGARSTIVRTATNLRLIVPNSKFLETNVINLTHGNNDMVRASINIGVAYGSDTRKTTKLLLQAAGDHGLVAKSPEPFVLFTEFGDNSLNFVLHFWVRVNRPVDRLRIESDLRYRVDSLFKDAGIVIAFPQRDVHIDSLGPIDVRLHQAVAVPESQSIHPPDQEAQNRDAA